MTDSSPPRKYDPDDDLVYRPDDWPQFPFLPLTRGDELGVLVPPMPQVIAEDSGWRVYLANLFDIVDALQGNDDVERYPDYEEYPGPADVLASGWRVD